MCEEFTKLIILLLHQRDTQLSNVAICLPKPNKWFDDKLDIDADYARVFGYNNCYLRDSYVKLQLNNPQCGNASNLKLILCFHLLF